MTLFATNLILSQRMESTGERNRIHLSHETAALLSAHGKGHWCIPRKDSVFAKGKGELKTYWLQKHPGTSLSFSSDQSSELASSHGGDVPGDELMPANVQMQRLSVQMEEERHARLIDWNTDLLMAQLKNIVVERLATESVPDPAVDILDLEMETLSQSGSVLEEVQDIIQLPRYVTRSKQVSGLDVEISEVVRRELRDYIATLSATYNLNSFHNFEHASRKSNNHHRPHSPILRLVLTLFCSFSS